MGEDKILPEILFNQCPTEEHIQKIRRVIGKATECKASLGMSFIDFRKASYAVEIWVINKSFTNARSEYVNLIDNIHRTSTTIRRIVDNTSRII